LFFSILSCKAAGYYFIVQSGTQYYLREPAVLELQLVLLYCLSSLSSVARRTCFVDFPPFSAKLREALSDFLERDVLMESWSTILVISMKYVCVLLLNYMKKSIFSFVCLFVCYILFFVYKTLSYLPVIIFFKDLLRGFSYPL